MGGSRMKANILVRDIDFDVLYQQRNALLELPDSDLIDGLINMLDSMLDTAADEGYFEFPKENQDEL
jgi:hypothetical protein